MPKPSVRNAGSSGGAHTTTSLTSKESSRALEVGQGLSSNAENPPRSISLERSRSSIWTLCWTR